MTRPTQGSTVAESTVEESTVDSVLDNQVSAQDKRALRHADSVVFRLWKGQATIEAIRDGRDTADGFDAKHILYVGAAHVADYHPGVSPEPGQRHWAGFHMEHHFNAKTRTLMDRLVVGGRVELHWVRNNTTEVVTEAGLVRDELYLHVLDRPGKTGTPARPAVYLVTFYVGYDNTARLIRLEWDR